VSRNKYIDRNVNQIGKIRLIFRIILLAYSSLKSKRDDILVMDKNIDNVFNFLEEFIVKYCSIYSRDNFEEKALDAFDEFEEFSTNNLSRERKSLLELLFDSINLMAKNVQREFIKKFFRNSIKLDRMLIAINILNDQESKNIIGENINNINIEDFVESCFMITNIEESVFQALYSENHWEIASALISKIKKHYSEIDITDKNIYYLLYQADLLFALRKNDLNAMQAVDFSQNVYSSREYKIEETKLFYIALHKLDNEQNYSEAKDILRKLLSADTQNTSYGITLFKAGIFDALNPMNIDSINITYNHWTQFLDNLEDKRSVSTLKNREAIEFYGDSRKQT
jgi:hypothetical protein